MYDRNYRHTSGGRTTKNRIRLAPKMFVIVGRLGHGSPCKLKIYYSRTSHVIFILALTDTAAPRNPDSSSGLYGAEYMATIFENYTKPVTVTVRPCSGQAGSAIQNRLARVGGFSEWSMSTPRGRFCPACGPCRRNIKNNNKKSGLREIRKEDHDGYYNCSSKFLRKTRVCDSANDEPHCR